MRIDSPFLAPLRSLRALRVAILFLLFSVAPEASIPRFTNTFDARNRLTKVEIGKDDWTKIRRYDYGINATGLRTGVTELTGTNSVQRRRVDYRYDAGVMDTDMQTRILPKVSRLTHEDIVEGSGSSYTGNESFLYDPLGNRRIFDESGVANVSGNAFEFDIHDQFDPAYGYGYAFDANGNTVGSPGSTTDSFDTENNLVKRVKGSETTTMIYDSEGHRVMRHYQTGSTHKTIYFLWDDKAPTGYPQVVLESVDTASSPLPSNATQYETFEWSRGLISLQYSGTNYYVGLDGHGSTRMLLDSNGNIVSGSEFDYDAHGNMINSPTTTVDVHYLFTGYERDLNLGMDHMGPRFYDPVTGRFWTGDSYEGTEEDPMSLHRYLYCAADPVNRWDPSGHEGLGSFMVSSSMRLGLAGASYGAYLARF